ncbi:MAG: toxin-antitoxin system YwqK family antitoxin [Flammeovirgaceae bacterium]|nr:toxin-antitoxin system YwqK family antitoxin [Flammeovirgaceae bacterium]
MKRWGILFITISKGHKLLEGHFMNAQLHGENIGYYADGTLRHTYQFKSGAKVGNNVDYYTNGKIRAKEQFALNGRDSKLTEYTAEGQLVFEKSFREGKPNGTWIFYAADGKTPSMKENYEDGQLHGTRTLYFPNGQKSTEETWKYNLITGPVKNYYEDGKILSVCEYRCRQHGLYTAYYPTGKIKEQGNYVANKKHNEWKEYDEQGKVVKTLVFRAGILIDEK